MTALTARARARLHTSSGGDETGTALILALLVVLVVGTLLAAVLDFTKAGLTIVPGERNDRNTSNYIQGAVQGAINNIRGSSELGREDVGCPTFTPPNQPSGVPGVSGRTFSVTCSGVATGVSGGDDAPRFAIQTLGAAPEGLHQVHSGGFLYIDGGVYSRGQIEVTGPNNSMRVNGTITARGGCSGPITTTDQVGTDCSAGPSPFDTAPPYQPALADDSALQTFINSGTNDDGADPVPTCGSGRVEFQPGYYGETPTDLATTLTSCAGSDVYHFNPGVYYFDYPGVWNLGSTKVVGGTYLGDTLGASCDHLDDATPAPGVQFIFGGSSAIYTKTNSGDPKGIEVCGPEKGHSLNGSPQRIAFYALSGANNLASPVPTVVTNVRQYTSASGPTPGGSPNWNSPAAALTIDGNSATTGNVATGNTATLDYDPLAGSAALPKGAVVTSVVIRVAQAPTGADGTLVLTSPRMSPQTINVSANNFTQDITSLLSAKDVVWRSLAGLHVQYRLTRSGGGSTHTGSLDGIEFQVTYRVPGLRATTCTGACEIVESENNSHVNFHGTVFAPTAAMSISLHNTGDTIFDRGVILRDLTVDITSSTKQTTSPFSVPHGTPTGRLVLFQGFVDGVEKVRACARYVDQAPNPDGSVSAYSGWSLTVPRWLVERSPTGAAATCT